MGCCSKSKCMKRNYTDPGKYTNQQFPEARSKASWSKTWKDAKVTSGALKQRMTGWEGPRGSEFLKPAGKDQPREGETESRGRRWEGDQARRLNRQVGLQTGEPSKEETITKTGDKVHVDRGPEKGGAARQGRPLSTPDSGNRGGGFTTQTKGRAPGWLWPAWHQLWGQRTMKQAP